MRRSIVRREQILTGASQSRHIKPTALALAVAACFSGAALANPTNPTVVHGTATFQQAGNILNITNSANAIINWGSFSISVGELTRFIQPSALSAVLNRVTGQDPSAILGALQSNGRVFLINPNGIVFGAGAQIDVAGLVASTLKLSNEDFLNNRMRFTDGVGAGSVVNQGQITGGSVYLVGNAVTNNGLITSPNGEVVLAAGNSVELVNPGTPNLRVEVVAAENEARNLGTISAEAGRIGIYAGLIRNSGTLNASSAVAEGGRILLKATKGAELTSSSVLEARGTDGGKIEVLSDMNEGVTVVGGLLDVSASSSTGNGGFVETSGANVQVGASTRVRSKGGIGGQSGLWLIDPEDFTIAYGGAPQTASGIGGDTLMGNLDDFYGGNIVIATSGATGGNGDIFVETPITWYSSHSLTLTAHRNVEVNSSITNYGNGGLNLYAGWDGVSSSANPSLVPTVGNIIVDAPIDVGAAIKMSAGNDIQILNSVIASGRSSYGGSASITLTGRSVLINDSVVAQGQNGSPFSLINGGNANIAIVAGAGGVTVNSLLAAYGGNASYGGTTGGSAGIQVTSSGNVAIHNTVRAIGGESNNGNGGSASIQLTSSGGSIGVFNGGSVSADGGESFSFGGTGGSAITKLNAALGIQVDGSEGYGYVRSLGGDGDTGGSAVVELVNNGSSSSITMTNDAWVDATGGDGPEGGVGGSALATLISAGNIVLNSGAWVEADGGYTSSLSTAGSGGAATVSMFAGGNVQIEGAEGAATGGNGFAGGEAAVLVVAGGNINVSNASYYNLTSSGGYSQYGTSGLASTVVSAAGDVNLSNAYLGSGGVVGLGAGNNIMVSASEVYGSTGLSISALGNLSVTNQSDMSGGGGNAFVNTGGNVLVDQSTIHGNPDVFMQVGGVININGTLAYGGKIEASSPSTININFTSTSGGFSVNGIAGLVYDDATQTGFFVNGAGASIGNGLNIVYSGTPPSTLNIPTENLLVAMGESTKPPDPEKDKDVFDEIKDDKKKDAPVCR